MAGTAREMRKALAKLNAGGRMRKLADVDEALAALGLQRRGDGRARFLTGVGLVLGGVVLGAVLGMLLAPTAGEGLRRTADRRNGVHPPTAPLS